MIITKQDIEDSKQNRTTFNKNYNDAVIDVLALKNDSNMSIKEIHEFTKYEINFIVHVINDYDKINMKTKTDINLINIIMMELLTFLH